MQVTYIRGATSIYFETSNFPDIIVKTLPSRSGSNNGGRYFAVKICEGTYIEIIDRNNSFKIYRCYKDSATPRAERTRIY